MIIGRIKSLVQLQPVLTVVPKGLLLKVLIVIHATALISRESQGPQLKEDHEDCQLSHNHSVWITEGPKLLALQCYLFTHPLEKLKLDNRLKLSESQNDWEFYY